MSTTRFEISPLEKALISIMEVMVGIFINALDTIASMGISCLTVYCSMHYPVLSKTMFSLLSVLHSIY